jgi:hypothetical protein
LANEVGQIPTIKMIMNNIFMKNSSNLLINYNL